MHHITESEITDLLRDRHEAGCEFVSRKDKQEFAIFVFVSRTGERQQVIVWNEEQ